MKHPVLLMRDLIDKVEKSTHVWRYKANALSGHEC